MKRPRKRFTHWKAETEIAHEQQSNEFAVKSKPFNRLAKEVMKEFLEQRERTPKIEAKNITPEALRALQIGAEAGSPLFLAPGH